ncbi:MAG: macrocin O-methyltransferase, partial [Acidocella sp.]|nr:macrocin O-methyltransferase [Acidocella sp.]
LYQQRGGLVRLEDDIKGLLGDKEAYGDISRFYFFCLAFDQMMKEGISGDVAELGTYKGETATVLATMARRLNTTAWILDTFEGFNPADLTGVDASHRMEFEDTSLDAVRALVGEENVRYVKGYFPESAAQMPEDLSFCIVHIDCDLYVPIAHALNYFYPRLVPGGYLIVHDYASLAWDGAERAVDEFFADKPEAVIPLTDGCGSAVIRKARPKELSSNWMMRKRCALFRNEWTSAGRGALKELLVSGWSGAEDWGVWGVGPSHILNLTMAQRPTADLVVQVDGAAALVPRRLEQEVDVFVDGEQLERWHFSKEENRAKRGVRIPAKLVTLGEFGFPRVRLEFRPRSWEPISSLSPESNDGRQLGIALFGLRRVE